MPFDGPTDIPSCAPPLAPANKALNVLNAILAILNHGNGWMQGDMQDREGHYCLVGAARKARKLLGVKGDRSSTLLNLALRREGFRGGPTAFNDNSTFENVEGLVRAAIILAQADAEGKPRPEGPSGLFALPKPAVRPAPEDEPPSLLMLAVREMEARDAAARAEMHSGGSWQVLSFKNIRLLV